VIYLLDTSGLVRLLGDPDLQEAWYDAVDAEAIGSCYPQRTEFLYSARNRSEYDEIPEMFGDLSPRRVHAEERRTLDCLGPASHGHGRRAPQRFGGGPHDRGYGGSPRPDRPPRRR